jgi:predicted Zn finger-like uncharacterized protein
MFTVCPKCALTLAVTAADLRIAQGYVRCGRCSSVFNALARLSEDRSAAVLSEPDTGTPEPAGTPSEPAEGANSVTAAPAESPPPAPPSDEVIPEEALEFNPQTTDVNSVFVQPPPDPQWTAATGSFRTLVAANQEATARERTDSQVDVEIDAAFLASMLRAETPEIAAEPSAPATVQPPPQVPAAPSPAARTTQPARTAPPDAPPARPAVASPTPTPRARTPVFGAAAAADERTTLKEEPDEPQEQDEEAASAAEVDEPVTGVHWLTSRLRAHAWSLGAALAAVLLVAQIVNHDRDELAASARFNRPLTSLYGALGIKLFPHWDLHAYDVRQLGAEADPQGVGVITVRASIKNGAAQPQPLPLLRVTLQDRFGNRIAARDVAPKAYLPDVIPAASFLSAGQRIDAEMGFADPGADAVGFEIDACLPARGGGIACANDATLR